MQSLKKEINEFIRAYFSHIKLRKPLFFKWRYGLRFNLQIGETGTEAYFEEVVSRAGQLFEETFGENDTVVLYLVDFKWKRRKLRFSNYCFKKIKNLTKDEVEYHTIEGLYGSEGSSDKSNIALIKILRNRINHRDIFKAIANKDFSRKPGLDQYGFLGSKEVYFINLDKQIIFHMYDDRGLDIIAGNIETIKPVYTKFKNWILESNRDEIDVVFNH